jgi:hypothetical protein
MEEEYCRFGFDDWKLPPQQESVAIGSDLSFESGTVAKLFLEVTVIGANAQASGLDKDNSW